MKKTTPGTTNKSKDSANTASGQPAKKSKSAGFIQSADFKPNWLETGPLPPDVLPDHLPDEEPPKPSEFDVLQDSLQRFYKEAGVEEPPQQATTESPGDTDDRPAPPITGAALDTAAKAVEIPAPPATEEAQIKEPETAAEALIVEESVSESRAEIETEKFPAVPVVAEAIIAEATVPTPEVIAPTANREEIETEAVIPVDAIPDPEDWISALPEVDTTTPYTTLPPLPQDFPDAGDVDKNEDSFIEDEFDELSPAVAIAATPVEEIVESKSIPKRKQKKRRDRLTGVLLFSSIILLGAAALVYFVNPFSRLALGAASLARPVASPAVASPNTGSGEWCLRGEFIAATDSVPKLIDNGTAGDLLADDQIFSLDYPIPQAGTHEWQIVDCNNAALAYPEAPAWVTTTEGGQFVTFNFDSNERADRLFFPIPYVVSALDNTEDFRVLGDFQDWNPEDVSGQLQRINIGLYQQVRRIARSGDYEAYVIAGDEQNAIDAYGRTTSPIPFSFQTERNGEYVVFLVDTDIGRASVMYDIPPILTSLAYGSGNWILSLALVGLAMILLGAMVLRLLILNNQKLQMTAGCPHCRRHELMRISRRTSDRLLHLFGIPAYRYRCRNCTWEGTRLSETGEAVSPGATLVYNERG